MATFQTYMQCQGCGNRFDDIEKLMSHVHRSVNENCILMSRSTVFGWNEKEQVAENRSNKRPRLSSLSSASSTNDQHMHDNDFSMESGNRNDMSMNPEVDCCSLDNSHTTNNNEDMPDDNSAPDGSQKISEAERQKIFRDSTLRTMPPTKEFLFALHGILSHPSIPRYVYSYVVNLINQMLNSKHRNSFWGHTFHTGREHVERELFAYFPAVGYKKKTFTAIDSEGKETTSSALIFNAKDFIMEDMVRNLNLLQPHKIALNPNTMWTKNVSVVDADGKKDFTETIAAEAYSKAHEKFITREDQLLVPHSCWIDETGITSILTKPTQPLLIKNLLFK